MVSEILTNAAIPHKETRYLSPPVGTYAIWMDAIEFRGPDNVIMLEEHSVTIELYADLIDSSAELRLESELINRGIEFEKSDHIWLNSEKLFETVYTFEFIKKRR